MGKTATTKVGVLLVATVLLVLLLSVNITPASADPGKMTWTIVNTPSGEGNVVVPGSEINAMAIGVDGTTFYVADTPNMKLYKSTSGGVTWQDISEGLFSAAGGTVRIWNVVTAPDDVNFVVAVTDSTTPGPRRVFVSKDGGQNWSAVDSGLTLAANEFIGCLDVSVKYGQYRDIAIGTRNGSAGGKVWVLQAEVTAPGWRDQNLTGTGVGDVVAVKSSPNYVSDSGLIAVTVRDGTAATRGVYLNLGKRDIVAGTTTWNAAAGYTGYPVRVHNAVGVNGVITVDLELPSDFLAATSPPDSPRRRYFIGINTSGNVGYLRRVDNTSVRNITPPISPPGSGIFSIAYYGDYRDGELLAGEVIPYAAGRVRIWRTSNPTYAYPRWQPSQPEFGSPTGGFGTGFANALLVWHPDGARAFCGTSSAALTSGGTSIGDPNKWPGALLVPAAVGDESAFSVTPCSTMYEMVLSLMGKQLASNVGEHWTQISLIDSNIQKLCDVAAINAPQPEKGGEISPGYDIQYLASLSAIVGGYSYSIWRSIGDPPGRSWERVMWLESHNGGKGILLRVRQPDYEEKSRSEVVTYTEVEWRDVGYSANEGQTWETIPGELDADIVDLAVAKVAYKEVVYALSSTAVYRYVKQGTSWQADKVYTDFPCNHTIAVPLKNPKSKIGVAEEEDWVIVGEKGPPDGYSRVAYADFSQTVRKFLPAIEQRKPVPIEGNVHVIADDRFDENKTIYAASHDIATGAVGKVYRWVIGKSTEWEELGPPNSAFYGLAMRSDVLYGAWAKAESIDILTGTGVDRTLYTRVPVPPPPEWDYLITGLPETGVVKFTCEPGSLKISGGKYNILWAIDNRDYDWQDQKGCLWSYTDIFAKVGPWTILPASGDILSCDAVSGRAKQIDFRWRQLDYASIYEMQIAKDKEFTNRVVVNVNVFPEDQESPAVFFPSGGHTAGLGFEIVQDPTKKSLVTKMAEGSAIGLCGNLECGHEYYWRVRARGATSGEEVRSPWSAVMYFTTKVGVPVETRYQQPVLLRPASGAQDVVRAPAFVWAPLPGVTKYEFVLAKDAELRKVLVKTRVTGNAFRYDGELDSGMTYFWQVRAVEPVASQPSAIASFTTERAQVQLLPRHREPVAVLTWAAIAVYTLLAAVVLVLIRGRLGKRKKEDEVGTGGG